MSIVVGQHPHSTKVVVKGGPQGKRIVPLKYLLYLPESYGKSRPVEWPLILFLHGRGERGNDLELLKKHPLPKMLDWQSDFPFVVLSPQLSLALELWTEMIEPLSALLDQIQATYSIDDQRIYLTGLSMGGAGTWAFALNYPERFAALAPIASFYREDSFEVPDNICDLKDVPIWAFHGDSDEIVPAAKSEVLVEALLKCGGNVRFTLYPGADHIDSWMRAYADPELYSWLLSHRRR